MKAAHQSSTLRTISFLLLFCLASIPAQAQYAGGTGEPNDPYRIASAEDLLEMSAATGDWDEHFVLTDNVNMDGHPLTDTVIGRGDVVDQQWSTGTLFTGTFDGNDFAIRNLVLDADGQNRDCVALFVRRDWRQGRREKLAGGERLRRRQQLRRRSGGHQYGQSGPLRRRGSDPW